MMFPNYVSHYFFISQSVPNLYFSYPTPANPNNYQYSYFTAPYQSPYKSRYQYDVIPKLGKSKSSVNSIYSQEKLIKSKSRNASEENLLNDNSSESLLEKSNSFDNYSTKTQSSEIKAKKKLRFIDTYRDRNYQKEINYIKKTERISPVSTVMIF